MLLALLLISSMDRVDSIQASEGSQEHSVYGCDNLPGSNPKLPQVNPN